MDPLGVSENRLKKQVEEIGFHKVLGLLTIEVLNIEVWTSGCKYAHWNVTLILKFARMWQWL